LGTDERLQFIEFSYLRNLFWSIGIGQPFTDLLDPVNHRRMVYTRYPLNTSKPHAVDVHFEAIFSYLIAIAAFRLGIFNELTATINTDVILFLASVAILADVVGLAFWALHNSTLAAPARSLHVFIHYRKSSFIYATPVEKWFETPCPAFKSVVDRSYRRQ